MSEMHRDFFIFVGLGMLLGALWNHFYVEPRDEFANVVSDCMIRKDDMSIASYQDCVDETRPARQETVNQ